MEGHKLYEVWPAQTKCFKKIAEVWNEEQDVQYGKTTYE